MTKTGYTHIKVIMDRSGSMDAPAAFNKQTRGNVYSTTTSWVQGPTVATEMVKALNEYFGEQAKLEGKCLVDYAQFDTDYESVYENTPIYAAKAVCQPRGATALTDAIGRGIDELGTKLAKMNEDARPERVIVVVITDGQENASAKYTVREVADKITHQEQKYGWKFVFLGANMDAVATAGSYGISRGDALTYDVHEGQATMGALNAHTSTYRTTGQASFTDADRRNAVGS